MYLLEHIRKQYPNKNVLYPDKVTHLRGIPLWELNAYGALPMSAANKKVNRKVAE